MTAVRHFWILVVLTLLKTFLGEDYVPCTFEEICILPCSFDPGNHVLIHWIKQTDIGVHSYYRDRDQLANQNSQYRGRTMMFKDQIPKGNASLKLTGVKPSDRGRYKCYTSTINGNKESFINLDVEAPPREVSVIQEGNVITCSSEGLLPEPTLTWTSNPPLTLTPNAPTSVLTPQELYNIRGSLEVSESDVDYICTVNSGRHSKTATLYKLTSVTASNTEAILPCMSSNIPRKSIVWRFNHKENILTQTSSENTFKPSEKWRKYVKSVSESGGLALHRLTSKQSGIYTCELSTDEEKHIRSTELMVAESQGSAQAVGIAFGVVAVIVVLAMSVGLLIFYKKPDKLFKKKRRSGGNGCASQEMTELKSNGERR